MIRYDHRGFGPSDGQPRQEFDPVTQCRDMQMAITFAQSRDAFDADHDAEHHRLSVPSRGFEESMEAGTRWFATHLMPEAASAG